MCTTEWNERQDAGRTFADAVAELMPRHADKRELIEAFGSRFDEMIPGALDGTVEIVAELKRAGVPRYALTNWSAETFPPQHQRFPFLSWFDGIVVSGSEGVIKPDPRIFRILLDRYAIARTKPCSSTTTLQTLPPPLDWASTGSISSRRRCSVASSVALGLLAA